MIAVALNDAVLVAPKSEVQHVEEAVTALKDKDRPAGARLPRDYRPWGWYRSIGRGERFQVKRIVVKPGAALSQQSHYHRAEHWIVVEGAARVAIDDNVQVVSENGSVSIPLGAKHRLDNPRKTSLTLIEVQTGAYLGGGNVVRYEDLYKPDWEAFLISSQIGYVL